MIIQHNIPALTAWRNGSMNQTALNNSLEKLSSGLHINRAGDDSAGLAISEKMRGQIRGLSQAGRNIQDSISLIQTAEGGLQGIHSLLQRGRELMVQAANDTNTLEDREAIQSEVGQILKEIDRISSTTEFNGISLLGGQTVVPPITGTFSGWPDEPAVDNALVKEFAPNLSTKEKIAESLKWSMLRQSEEIINNGYGIKASGVSMDIKFVNNPSESFLAYVSYYIDGSTQRGKGLSLVVNEAYFQEMSFPDGGTYPMYLDRIIAHELVHATMASTMKFGNMPKWFKEGTAEFIHGADERLEADLSYAGVDGIINAIGNGTDSSWVNDSLHYSTGYVAVRYMHDEFKKINSDGIKALMEKLSSPEQPSLDEALAEISQGKYSNLQAFVSDFKQNGKAFLQKMIDDDYLAPNNTDTGAIGGKDADGGPEKNAREVVPDVYDPSNPIEGFNLTWPAGMDTVIGAYGEPSVEISIAASLPIFHSLNFQIGANNGQGIQLDLLRADTTSLQISAVNAVSAESAIERFDQAIEKISSHRSYLGAMQNRLEHTLFITNNYHEQISNAESRIRDVDMAKEMMAFTKKNILGQAAQSMLAQANQRPQAVLQLLHV